MTRANSLLEVTPSELRVGTHSHPVTHRVARKASDDDLLEAYLDFVRSLRSSAGNVWLRNDDLEVLSAVLGWTPDAVRADLEGRMVVRQVASKKKLKKRRVVFAAYGLAIVGSALVTATYDVRSNHSVHASSNASVKVGSALTIDHIDSGVRTVDAAGLNSAADAVHVGDAQTITHD
jgi:hypothetical protein